MLALLAAAALALTPSASNEPDRIVGQTITLSAATSADPSSILTSATQDGLHIAAVLEDPTTVADTPDEGACWSVATRDVFGALHDVDPEDAVSLRLWLGDTGLPPSTQVTAVLTNGALGAATVGFGVGLRYGASGPLVVSAKGNGSWAVTAASATSKAIVGAELSVNSGASASGFLTGWRTHAIDRNADPVKVTNSGPAADTLSSSTTGYDGPFDTLSLCVGWFTGAGGSAGARVVANVDLAVTPQSRVASLARSPITDTVYTVADADQLSILWLTNSNGCGAASGTQDADYGGDAVNAGQTAGMVYRSNGAAVTTFGVRPGVVPYLGEELIDAGIAAPVIVTSCGSGWAAADILANMDRAVFDTYVAAPTNRPDAIIYQQQAGNVADQAAYDAFVTDFEAVLDELEAEFGTYQQGGPRIYVTNRTLDDDVAYPFGDEVVAEKARQCAGDVRCVLVDIEGVSVDPANDNHPTVGIGGGNDQIADRLMGAMQ